MILVFNSFKFSLLTTSCIVEFNFLCISFPSLVPSLRKILWVQTRGLIPFKLNIIHSKALLWFSNIVLITLFLHQSEGKGHENKVGFTWSQKMHIIFKGEWKRPQLCFKWCQLNLSFFFIKPNLFFKFGNPIKAFYNLKWI